MNMRFYGNVVVYILDVFGTPCFRTATVAEEAEYIADYADFDDEIEDAQDLETDEYDGGEWARIDADRAQEGAEYQWWEDMHDDPCYRYGIGS